MESKSKEKLIVITSRISNDEGLLKMGSGRLVSPAFNIQKTGLSKFFFDAFTLDKETVLKIDRENCIDCSDEKLRQEILEHIDDPNIIVRAIRSTPEVYPSKDFFKQYISYALKEREREVEKLLFIQQIESTNIFFYYTYPVIGNNNDDGYVRFIIELLRATPIREGTSLNDYEVHLILHKSDSKELSKHSDFTVKVTDKVSEDSKLLNDIRRVAQIEDITIWGFTHYVPKSGIYRDVICNANFFDEPISNKEDFLVNKLNHIYENTGIKEVTICLCDKNGESKYYLLHNGEEITGNLLEGRKPGSNNSLIIQGKSDRELEDKEFYTCIANLQLCGCNIKTYQRFKKAEAEVRATNSEFDFDRLLFPIFHKNGTSEFEPKPITIYGYSPIANLKDISGPLFMGTDRRINFLDSSIWIRFAPSLNEFNEINNKINNNYQSLYPTLNAKECLEFRARSLKNSFLRPFNLQNSHAQYVSPFLFHSEYEMQQKSKKILEEISKYQKLKWRVLLLDDHAEKANLPEQRSKCEIIRNILLDSFNISFSPNKKCSQVCHVTECIDENERIEFEIDCADNIEMAKLKIMKNRYDIIFLDYLLDLNSQKTHREYSYQLLSDIKTIIESAPNKVYESKGPFNQFWFFFISAFTNAVSERLHEQGMHYNTENWHIARGACPTTTPELFKYNLLSFMSRQLEVMTKLPKAKGDAISPNKLLRNIYSFNNDPEDQEKQRFPRKLADRHFDDLLKMKANYQILKKDYYYACDEDIKEFKKEYQTRSEIFAKRKTTGSLLVQSLFTDLEHYDNAFWEHLTHLVYLTAYGTIRQWPEMWAEFLFVKPNLDKAEKEIDMKNRVSTAIESYIIDLKYKSES